ncbi:MAG: FAD-dependent oxidoreductase [Halanaerobiales bacterium]|nr:FAD-dependent oxidoreductase [Halanaerobiales bacterium]
MSKLSRIKKKMTRLFGTAIECREWRSSIVLEGIVNSWEQVVAAGNLAAGKGYKGVVNRIEVKGLPTERIRKPDWRDHHLNQRRVDVLVIGGGIIGSAIIRELAKWELSVLLVDKEGDLAMHTSSRNDGMIHPGLLPKPGSRKAYFNVRGNELYSRVTKELNVDFTRPGSFILYDQWAMKLLYPLIKLRARRNKVKDLRLIGRDELQQLEPGLAPEIRGALYIPSAGVLSPYKMTIAYAENAVANGAEVSLNTMVEAMEKKGDEITAVKTNRGKVFPRIIINAAGVFSDVIADLAGDQFFTIHPRKGEIILLDRKKGELIKAIYSRPEFNRIKGSSKGGGIIKTIEGNVLIGPDAYEQPYREDFTTNRENILALLERFLPIFPELSAKDVITYFSGIRAATYEEDFIIEKSEYVQNLIHAAGIQSPGLASAPAIAEEIEKLTLELLSGQKRVKARVGWNPVRKAIPELSKMGARSRGELIRKKPAYGEIVCRCEEISRGEVIDALQSPIPATTLDAIKRRVRAGMGRCQGEFCTPLLIKIMEEEGFDIMEITKKGNNSYLLLEETKG